MQAVFSPDSLQAKRNTDAIEVAPNTMMAARVIDYKPAAPRAFDEVKADIRRQLEHTAASELAQKAGKEKLALLQQGKDAGLVFGKPVTLTRNQAQPGFQTDALARIFQGDPAKLPEYVGMPARRRRLRHLQDRSGDRSARAGCSAPVGVFRARRRAARP